MKVLRSRVLGQPRIWCVCACVWVGVCELLACPYLLKVLRYRVSGQPRVVLMLSDFKDILPLLTTCT